MYKNETHWHSQHTICAGVSGVTKDARPASCAVVASQWAGGAVRDGEVLFSVFFVPLLYSSLSLSRERERAAPLWLGEVERQYASAIVYLYSLSTPADLIDY